MIHQEPLHTYLKSEAFRSPLGIPAGTEPEFSLLGQGEYNLNYVFSHPVTAQKLVLNMISTGTMVGIGKAYQNLMVDVQQTNEKLVVRAQNICMEATGCEREVAKEKIELAGGHVKTAIVMILANCGLEEAKERLEKGHGHVRQAIQ